MHDYRRIQKAILLVASALTLQVSAAAEYSLDLRKTSATRGDTGAGGGEAAVLDVGVCRQSLLPAGAADLHELSAGDLITLSLYDDVSLKIRLLTKEEAPLSKGSFQAEVIGSHWRDAAVTETENGLLITATDPQSGLLYTIVSSEKRVTVKEINTAAREITDLPSPVPEIVMEGTTSAKGRSTYAATGAQTLDTVDILVAFDTGATRWASMYAGGITNLAQQCVTRMNTALANNNLSSTCRFRLVGVLAVDLDAGNSLSAALSALQSGSSGWSVVHDMRDATGADTVTLMIDTGYSFGTTGLGYSLTYTTPSDISIFAPYAYNTISVRAAPEGHVMTHETGHNMGTGHSDMQASSPGPQSYPYSSGYYFKGTDGKSYHTIMSYNSRGNGDSTIYKSAPLFSDSANTWAGTAAGDADHDNARVLRNNFSAISKFRRQVIPFAHDITFSPAPRTVFSDSVTVVITPGEEGVAIRYTTDGTVPGATTGMLYTGPFVITETTTVKAVAVVNGTAGPVAEARYFRADYGTALNAAKYTWTTSSQYPWVIESSDAFDGELAVQTPALPKGAYKSTWISTTVKGPAQLTFQYHAMIASSDFKVLLGNTTLWSTSEEVEDWTLVELEIPEGEHTLKFAYDQRGYYLDPIFCGVWLDCVTILTEEPEPDGVEHDDGYGNSVLIPREWFEGFSLAESGAQAETLAAAADADSDSDGVANWAEYICGTDPTDPADHLRCTISIVNGSAEAGYLPETGYLEGYRPVLRGKENLTDPDWSAIGANRGAFRFFKVFVEKE